MFCFVAISFELPFLRPFTKRSALRLGWKKQEKAIIWLFRRFFTADTRFCQAEWRRQNPGVKEIEAAGSNPVASTMLNVHNGTDRYEHSFLF